MTRQTSIDAYNTIKNNGLLSKRKWQVYDYIHNNGPCTSKEAWKGIDSSIASGSITTRFSELLRMGIIAECGDTIDKQTHMRATLWTTTENLPIKLNKNSRQTRKHLEKCRQVLMDIYNNKDLPSSLKTYIFDEFNKENKK